MAPEAIGSSSAPASGPRDGALSGRRAPALRRPGAKPATYAACVDDDTAAGVTTPTRRIGSRIPRAAAPVRARDRSEKRPADGHPHGSADDDQDRPLTTPREERANESAVAALRLRALRRTCRASPGACVTHRRPQVRRTSGGGGRRERRVRRVDRALAALARARRRAPRRRRPPRVRRRSPLAARRRFRLDGPTTVRTLPGKKLERRDPPPSRDSSTAAATRSRKRRSNGASVGVTTAATSGSAKNGTAAVTQLPAGRAPAPSTASELRRIAPLRAIASSPRGADSRARRPRDSPITLTSGGGP